MKKLGVLFLALIVLAMPAISVKAVEKTGELVGIEKILQLDLANVGVSMNASVKASAISANPIEIQIGVGKEYSAGKYRVVQTDTFEVRAVNSRYSKTLNNLGSTANVRSTFNNNTTGTTFRGTVSITRF